MKRKCQCGVKVEAGDLIGRSLGPTGGLNLISYLRSTVDFFFCVSKCSESSVIPSFETLAQKRKVLPLRTTQWPRGRKTNGRFFQ